MCPKDFPSTNSHQPPDSYLVAKGCVATRGTAPKTPRPNNDEVGKDDGDSAMGSHEISTTSQEI